MTHTHRWAKISSDSQSKVGESLWMCKICGAMERRNMEEGEADEGD